MEQTAPSGAIFHLVWLEVLLISLWIQVVPGTHTNNGIVSHLSKEDVFLLKDEPNPKCFTRTKRDFTCFFETADSRTYDFLFPTCEIQPRKRRCELSVQRTEAGTFLHICSFPESDVCRFHEMLLEVVDRTANAILYSRPVSVQDHLLLDPPYNVSLHPNGQVGQLQVSWQTKISKYQEESAVYRIRCSSRVLGEKTTEAKPGALLNSLVPGEEVQVQVQVIVKSGLYSHGGHWSGWSHPARATVPQRAGDISLICYTSDLRDVTCHWNGSRYEYKLFYKIGFSAPPSWTEWTECLDDGNVANLCRFRGDKSRKFRVKLGGAPAPSSRTFYTEEFTLSNSIKTSPPGHLTAALKENKLCFEWETPLPSLSSHLLYDVDYQIQGGKGWKMIKGPETDACVEVPAGSRYSVKVRAKPAGSIYSGRWSDWSDVVTGDAPADTSYMKSGRLWPDEDAGHLTTVAQKDWHVVTAGFITSIMLTSLLLMLCIPVFMLIMAIIVMAWSSTYLSKLKQFFWPPVPNLDKVLQGFLTEMNKQEWDPPITAKQCFEETMASVVEIMSEDEVSRLGKPSDESTELLSSEGSLSSREQVDGSPGTEIFPEYVTLNKDSVVLCPQGNSYVYEQDGETGDPVGGDELLQRCDCSCGGGSVCLSTCSCADFVNHSYLPLAEPADKSNCKVTAVRSSCNLYTNFPHS